MIRRTLDESGAQRGLQIFRDWRVKRVATPTHVLGVPNTAMSRARGALGDDGAPLTVEMFHLTANHLEANRITLKRRTLGIIACGIPIVEE